MEELKKPFLSVNQSVGKCLICNKDICANDASRLTHKWNTLTNLARIRSNVVLLIDHKYHKYMQIHELIGDRKTAFCK